MPVYLSAYCAASELTQVRTTGSITTLVQVPPTGPQFMTFGNNNGFLPLVCDQDKTKVPLVNSYAMCLPEVPSSLGGLSTNLSHVYVNLSLNQRPYELGATAYDTSLQAQQYYFSKSIVNYNSYVCTKPTGCCIVSGVSAQSSSSFPVEASVGNPAQFQSVFPVSTTATAAYTGYGNWTTSNAPSSPACLIGSNTTGPSGSSAFNYSSASGTIAFMVQSDCYINIGPTDGGSLKSAVDTTFNSFTIYVFRYTDLCSDASLLQPWAYATAGPGKLTTPTDQVAGTFQYAHKTYLQGQPYYFDERYDPLLATSGLYGTLGRSLRIDQNTIASKDGLPVGSFGQAPQGPLIVLFCPGATLDFSADKKSLLSTYSNNLLYNYSDAYNGTGAYSSTQSNKQQVYSIAFTTIEAGPFQTFFGLNNASSVLTQSTTTIVASNTSINVASTSALRKVYVSSFAATSSTLVNNEQLGLDIRQVYPPQSMCIGTENSTSSASYFNYQYNVSALFNLRSLFSPDQVAQITSNWLPLAGTWVTAGNTQGDLDFNNYAKYAGVQVLPNYEGLSVIGQWPTDATGNPSLTVPSNGPEGVPQWNLVAVDRAPYGPIEYGIATNVPYDVVALSQYRPLSVFVLLCDVWRNSLRTPQPPGTGDPQNALNDLQAPILGSNNNTFYKKGTGTTSNKNSSSNWLPLAIQYYDCMNHEDYNTGNPETFDFFSTCSGNPTAQPAPLPGTSVQVALVPNPSNSLEATWNSSPWTTNNGASTWNPFTGGAQWGDYQIGAVPGTTNPNNSVIGFSPSLWWPTYDWVLGTSDVNNVWTTSCATNPTLQQAQKFVFTCTDGTIRKGIYSDPTSPQDLVYPAIDSTGSTTFLNSAINGIGTNGESIISYVDPGRLYNLIFWQNHWWCTADTASVYTTAPVLLSDGTLNNINPSDLVVSQMQCSLIQFRPLTTEEGGPQQWISATWPSNEQHKFNLMKPIIQNNQECLIIGSIDGEYAVVVAHQNAQGQTYFSGTNSMTSDAVAIGFLPVALQGPPNTQVADSMLYMSDIVYVNGSLVVGSMPVQVNPATTTLSALPWALSNSEFLTLPVMSLSYTRLDQNAFSSLIGQLNVSFQWYTLLQSSNVLTTKILITFDESDPSMTNISSRIQTIAQSISLQTIGGPGQMNGSSQIVNGTQGPTGFSQLLAPAQYETQDFQLNFYVAPSDNKYSFVYTTGNSTVYNYQTNYGIVSNTESIEPLGYIALTHDFRNTLLNVPFTVVTNGVTNNIELPALYRSGFTMDRVTQAFFVFADTASNPTPSTYAYTTQLGLKSLLQGSSTTQLNTLFANQPIGSPGSTMSGLDQNSNALAQISRTTLATAPLTTPMWQNSLAYVINLKTLNGNTYSASLKQMLHGPINSAAQQNGSTKTISDNDLSYLGIFNNSLLVRASPILANLEISDVAVAAEAYGIAWTTFGPFGPQPLSISALGASQLDPLAYDVSYASNVLPQVTGPGILQWNAYEMKWYFIGPGRGTYDFIDPNNPPTGSIESPQLPYTWSILQDLIRPRNIDATIWANNVKFTPTRLLKLPFDTRTMIMTADASSGITQNSNDFFTNYGYSNGSSIPWTQVYSVTNVDSNNTYLLDLVSNAFDSIVCIGFSPNITAIGGSVYSTVGAITTANALVAYRVGTVPAGNDLQANWSFAQLGLGTVSALKYVEYAWYIATWDSSANSGLGKSYLYFATINFNAITLLDEFDTLDNANYYIKEIQSNSTQSGVCAPGYEPNPNIPTECLKICPAGFSTFGTLCVLKCPGPYQETGQPNECKPDSRTANFVFPSSNGNNLTSIEPSFGSKGLTKQSMQNLTSLNEFSQIAVPSNYSLDPTILFATAIVISIAVLVIVGFVFKVILARTFHKTT